MSKLYDQSEEADVEELSLFAIPDTNCSVIRKSFREIRPTTQISRGTPVQFLITGHGLDYVYMKRTKLYMKCRIADRNGNPPAQGDVVYPVNHLLNSAWSALEIKLNDKLVTQNSNNYAFKSYIKTLMYNTSSPAEVASLGTELFSLDTSDNAEYEKDFNTTDLDEHFNKGAAIRIAETEGGKSFEVQGTLAADFFDLPKYLLNGVKIQLTLYPNRNDFVLMSSNENVDYELIIEDACLKVCVVDIANAIISAQNSVLESMKKAQYFMPRTELRSFTVAQGLQTAFLDNVFTAILPQKLVIVMVDSQAYSGHKNKSPFNFQHNKIKHLTVFVNGTSQPGVPMIVDFEKNLVSNALSALYDNSTTSVITKENFSKGYSMFCFDLCAESEHKDLYTNKPLCLEQTGVLRVEAIFSEQLKSSMQLLVYGEFQSSFVIDSARNVQKEQ